MNKLLNWIKKSISGNKLWFGIGAGVLGTYFFSSTNKAFYYGLASMVVFLKLIGSKVLPRKWNNWAIIGCAIIFIYSFFVEVVLKRDSGLTSVKNFFGNVWSKLTSYLPTSNNE